MPTIFKMGSIKILIYFDDHLPPHFHAEYNEFEELIIIDSLKTYRGKLPVPQKRKVMDWAKGNRNFLFTKWTEFNL